MQIWDAEESAHLDDEDDHGINRETEVMLDWPITSSEMKVSSVLDLRMQDRRIEATRTTNFMLMTDDMNELKRATMYNNNDRISGGHELELSSTSSGFFDDCPPRLRNEQAHVFTDNLDRPACRQAHGTRHHMLHNPKMIAPHNFDLDQCSRSRH